MKKQIFFFYKFEQQRGGSERALQKGSYDNDNHFFQWRLNTRSVSSTFLKDLFLKTFFLSGQKKFLTLKMDSFFNAGLVRAVENRKKEKNLGSKIGNPRDVACQKN